MSPTRPASPPFADAQARLVRFFLSRVAAQRAWRRRTAYAGWPQRRSADAQQSRWPLFLRDPERALVRSLTHPGPGAFPLEFEGAPLRADRYTPEEMRAAANTVLTALALEEA